MISKTDIILVIKSEHFLSKILETIAGIALILTSPFDLTSQETLYLN